MVAFILNELTGQKRVRTLIFLVALTLALELAVSLIGSALNRALSLRWLKFWQEFGINHNLKMSQLDYASVEDPKTHRMFDRYAELLTKLDGGMPALASGFSDFCGSVMTALFSLEIIVELFALGIFGGNYGSSPLNSIPATVIILILTAVLCAVKIRFGMSAMEQTADAVEQTLPFRRIFRYYTGDYVGNYRAGKDIRLYAEQELISRNMMSGVPQTKRAIAKMNWGYTKWGISEQTAGTLTNLGVYLLVALRCIAGCFGMGNILKYSGGILNLTYGISGMIENLSYLRAKNDCLEAMFAYLDLPNKMELSDGKMPDMINGNYTFEFKNVSFRYPDTDFYALKNLNLTFTTGQRLAVVGQNGSGKSTFIKLLCRMYDVTEGEILCNGMNIKSIRYEDYTGFFAVVFQDFSLFSLPLGQNVAASKEYNRKKAERCLYTVGFGDRLKTLEKGLDTCLYRDFDDSGIEISGGEAQKIAFSRALYRASPVLILDEPTAALDLAAESEIYKNFDGITQDKTAVFISHHLSSCRFCGDILVFRQGQLVERGSHEALLSDAGGEYHALWRAQAQYYE